MKLTLNQAIAAFEQQAITFEEAETFVFLQGMLNTCRTTRATFKRSADVDVMGFHLVNLRVSPEAASCILFPDSSNNHIDIELEIE